MAKTLSTIEEIREQGYSDAMEAVRDSGTTQTPDGGWDSWLINMVGCDAVKRLFGEPVDQEEWSESMQAKLVAYTEGCQKACDEVNADN